MPTRALFVIVLVLVSGCASIDPYDGLDPAIGCVDELPERQALPPGHSIVACGVAPEVVVIGVEDGVAYSAGPDGAFFAHDLRQESVTRLYRGWNVYYAEGAAVFDGELWYSGWSRLDDGTRGPWAVMAIATDRVTEDDHARVVLAHDEADTFGLFLHDGERVYSSTRGPVVAIDPESGALEPMTSEMARLAGLAGDALYYCATDGLRRTSTRGGASELVSDTRPLGGCVSVRAFDAEFAYFVPEDAPLELWRHAPGGVAERLYVVEDHVEVSLGPPTSLRRDGDYLYFLRAYGLYRARADGEGTVELVANGAGLAPPLFDETNVYVPAIRGGDEGPVERVILRIERASLDDV